MIRVQPQPGDILVFRRVGYAHYAVQGYRKTIYEVSGIEGKKNKGATVTKRDFNISDTFLYAFHIAAVDNALDDLFPPFSPSEIVERAESQVGKPWNYNLGNNNCEHFAKWCRYGKQICQQLVHRHDDGGFKDMAVVGLGALVAGPAKLELPNAHLGVRKDDAQRGFKAQYTLAAAELGPARVQAGVGVSTGVRAGDNTIGAEVLGTGFSFGRVMKISLLGNSISFKLW